MATLFYCAPTTATPAPPLGRHRVAPAIHSSSSIFPFPSPVPIPCFLGFVLFTAAVRNEFVFPLNVATGMQGASKAMAAMNKTMILISAFCLVLLRVKDDKLMFIYNYVEMARVTGVPISFLLARGQSIKVLFQLLRKAKQKNLVLPNVKQAGSEQGTYEGIGGKSWVL
ncbi:DNA polymerase delta catalytic subunit [Arachis hypogaea]|nr:DNA polymerase delta catalytic subunit [Arachis hypogaea]